MIKTSVEQLAEPIGFDIANSDDTVQADLLNGLARGFKLHSEIELSRQLNYVVNGLTEDAEKFILELAEYVKLKNR
jgi:hypothetical protein